MHEITKEFGLDYGHRVHNQTLNKEYSIDDCLVCRHLHGHRMTVFVTLKAEKLEAGMVTDFKHMNWFKDWLDMVVDHKFIIDINDPMFERITGRVTKDVQYITDTHGYLPLMPTMMPDDPIKRAQENEITESFVVVHFVPTSENISKWLYNIAKKKMLGIGIEVSKITMMETPKSKAVYYEA